MNLEKYFLIVAEIDYIYWQLEALLKTEKNLTPIAKMIDMQTGYYDKKLKIVNSLIKRAEKLKKKINYK